METIYKGEKFSVSVTSDKELDLSQCNLYNAATQTRMAFDVTKGSTVNGIITYTFSLDTTKTSAAPVGVYNLECFAPNNGAMLYFQQNYARFVATSKSPA